MDDSPKAPAAGPAPDCVPLRLVLQPGGAVIERVAERLRRPARAAGFAGLTVAMLGAF